MTQEELVTRINTWMALPMYKNEPYLVELNALYFEITGQKVLCKGCNYNAMKRVLRHYLNNPYTLNKSLHLNSTTMAKPNKDSKYQFTTAASKESIVLHTERGGTKVVTADTLTDEDAEAILSNPGLKKAYGHNIEKKQVAEGEAKNAKGKAQAEQAKNKVKKAKKEGDNTEVDTDTDIDTDETETTTDSDETAE